MAKEEKKKIKSSISVSQQGGQGFLEMKVEIWTSWEQVE